MLGRPSSAEGMRCGEASVGSECETEKRKSFGTIEATRLTVAKKRAKKPQKKSKSSGNKAGIFIHEK